MRGLIVCILFIIVWMLSICVDGKILGGAEPQHNNKLSRSINIITQKDGETLATKLRDDYSVAIFQSYPKFNRPSFITITDIKPVGEIPSTYILWTGLPDDAPARALHSKIEDIADQCNNLSNGILEPPQKSISMYNVGEHIFTKKAPSKNAFNYDQSFDIWVDDRDTLIRESAMKGVPYEKYMTACLSAFIEPGATILDIGTNVGTVSLPLSRLRDATVVSFEPFPETFAVLFKNIIQNRAYNIVPIRMCVGDKWRKEITLSDTVVVLPHYQDKTGAKPQIVDLRKDVDVIHFGAVGIGKGKVKAPMTSVDDLHLNISAMKVDVEGAEPMVFYGAKETIKRCMPVIVFERNEKIVSDDMKNVLGISDAIANFEIVDYCRTLGYKDFYELDIQDYMLVPPGRKQYETHSIAKFRPTTLIKGFSPKETMGYNLYRFTRPKWGKNE